MRLLLDTHIAFWAAARPQTLTEAERAAMSAPDVLLVLSAVSVWELRLKWRSLHASGLRQGPIDPAAMIGFANRLAWELLPLTAQHAAASLVPQLSHRDPFDELLLAQAQEEGMRLLTRDAKLINHPLAIGRASG